MKGSKLIAVILALVSSTAFSGTMGLSCPVRDVTVPCDKKGWDFGIQALYLKPAYRSVLRLANQLNTTEPNPGGRWGFRVNVSHHFGQGNDLYIIWNHHDNKTTYSVLDGADNVGRPFTVNADNKWDAVNAEFGQTVNFSLHKKIRFYGGAQYTRIDNHFGLTIPNTPPSEYFSMEYEGFGPRLGVDMSYSWRAMTFYVKTAAAVLIGNHSFKSITSGILDVNGHVRGSHPGLVPEFESKIGLTYVHALAQSDLFIDAGYRWLNYFSAHTLKTASFSKIGGDTDFGLYGPYIGIKYMGYV